MPPLLIGTFVAVAIAATYLLMRKALLETQKPVRAEIPIRRLRRDPVTGEYRPM